jgi:hypothetical protein
MPEWTWSWIGSYRQRPRSHSTSYVSSLGRDTRLSKMFTEDKTTRGVKGFGSSWRKCGVMEVVIVGTETVSLAETVQTWIDIISIVR